MPPASIITSAVGYVRLHGRSAAGWLDEYGEGAERPPDPYLYTAADLEAWKHRIEQISRHTANTFIVFTNDVEASSVVNALQMQAMLGGRASAPAELLATRPDELAGFGADRPVQPRLFERRQVA